MVNNTYLHLGKHYPIGGIINGEIDNMVLTGGTEDTVYDIEIETGVKISLTDKYGLMIEIENKAAIPVQASQLVVGQKAYVPSGILFDFRKILSITERKGKHITIPREVFILSGVFVTSKFRSKNYDFAEEIARKDTCSHRSKDRLAYKIKMCCGREEERLDFFCEAKKKHLLQPECWNCDLYKKE